MSHQRPSNSLSEREKRKIHILKYFHGSDEVSPEQETRSGAQVHHIPERQRQERPTATRERPTTSGTRSVQTSLYEGPRNSTPLPNKRRSDGREDSRSRTKDKKAKWDDLCKNFFVGPVRVFDLVERFPEDMSSSSSSEE